MRLLSLLALPVSLLPLLACVDAPPPATAQQPYEAANYQPEQQPQERSPLRNAGRIGQFQNPRPGSVRPSEVRGTGEPTLKGNGPATTGFDAGEYCVQGINSYRATQNLPPLRRDASREACADGEAQKDGVSKEAHGAMGACGEKAQNECPGWPNDRKSTLDGCIRMMWQEGPGADYSAHGHYINMSSAQYTHAFCGFSQAPDGSLWVVQNFY